MSENTTAPLVLVDGSSYLYRAFHAMYKADLRTSSGEPVGAIRGVTSMLRRLKLDYPGSTIVVIFDAKGKTFRDEMYSEYKAQRPPMPDDMRPQIEPIHNIVRAMGMPLLVIEGVEADDVMGTLADQATQLGIDVVLSTGDKDMAQLVNQHVSMVNTMTETVMDIDGVKEKFGIPPELIIDYLALMGDKVDNIPGVPGVGEKTALALLQGLGGLDVIYANLDKVADLDFRGAKKMHEKLEANKDLAFLSYQLATIKLDVELEQGPQDLVMGPEDREALVALFTEFEFKSWIDEYSRPVDGAGFSGEAPAAVETEYETVLTKAELDGWIEQLNVADLFAFDTETTSVNYMEAKLVGVSFAVEAGKAAYVPFGHDYLGAPEQLSQDEVLEALRPLLESEQHKKVGQNLKYDMNVLANHGIHLKGVAEDTMLESYVLNSTLRHNMDALAERHLGHTTIHFEDVAGKGVKQLTFNQVALEEASPYAAEDADITLRLHQALQPQLLAVPKLQEVYREIEMPLLDVLSRIERNGALIDSDMLFRQSHELAERMQQLECQAFDLAGEEFNLGSPKQLQVIFYEKLELPILKKTPKGQPSTAEPVLQELALDYELPRVILEYRSLSKLKSTYTDKLPAQVSPKTGRVHTSYHQAVTATGRLSSSDPNLQNIPIRTEEGRKIRDAFIAAEGYQLVAADYSQIELRIMAHLSQDKGLLDAFANGLDVHSATASEVFDTPFEEVSADQRRSAKAINFGLIYGMSAFGLGRQLGINRNEAQRYIDMYFARYPGVLSYMDTIRSDAGEKGYVETLFGRRLYLPEINSSNGMRRQAAERTAINAPMQGTAADIIKKAMLAVDQWLTDSKLDAKVIMQVHDELVLEVADADVEAVTQGLHKYMSETVMLDVPLIVDIGCGANWGEAH
ncbi:MAG: DNA polymerase I [Pseudomonadales bacterium]